MTATHRPLPLLLLLTAAACSTSGGEGGLHAPGPSARTWSFEDPPGGMPAEWRIETTNPREAGVQARWQIRAEAGAPSGERIAALVDPQGATGQAYNLCWTAKVEQADVELEVAVRAESGEEDQGGGPAWRVQGADNYYLVRWNPLEDNFRLYYVQDGERVQIASAHVEADPSAWHRIRVSHAGTGIACAFDGEVLLRAEDATHTLPGGVGLWTKADAATAFDDLVLWSK